ncbi:MAG: tRNA (adenosine(37)-N6)-threonylcarbamoyltransferase complex transferase subunit TsaD [Alphaproteobacteria bacterium]
MIVLGIETSCDETAAALVTDRRELLADLVLSQLKDHAPYGGVVPEIAARRHIDHLDGLIARAMREAGLGFEAIDAVAATAGPGLIGALMVGLMTGKAIAAVRRVPFIAVNHLEAHALTARLIADVGFPYLLLLVSGGHCQLLIVEGVGRYRRLGTTIDDAAGEAFDKAAKLIGLGYPGGPAIERAAKDGDPARFALPRPLHGRPGCDFSFAGLKTAVLHLVNGLDQPLSPRDQADIAASFQQAVADALIERTGNAIREFKRSAPGGRSIVVSGGVAANALLRQRLAALAAREGLDLLAPPLRLCTDNAAMIAWAGVERLRLGLSDPLDFAPRPRWPLDEAAALPAGIGKPGRLGRKA